MLCFCMEFPADKGRTLLYCVVWISKAGKSPRIMSLFCFSVKNRHNAAISSAHFGSVSEYNLPSLWNGLTSSCVCLVLENASVRIRLPTWTTKLLWRRLQNSCLYSSGPLITSQWYSWSCLQWWTSFWLVFFVVLPCMKLDFKSESIIKVKYSQKRKAIILWW